MFARLQPFALELRDSQGRAMGEGRAVGVHLGDIIKHMRVHALGEKLDGKGGEVRMAAGFILETLFEQSLGLYLGQQRKVVRPDETRVDGIYMNADAINLDDGFLEDYKATWKSRRKIGQVSQCQCRDTVCTHWGPTPEEIRKHFWHWLVQGRSYARAYGTRHVRFLILWVMGDYSYKPPNGEPHIVSLEFEFTQEELDANWAMVKQYARDEMGLQGIAA